MCSTFHCVQQMVDSIFVWECLYIYIYGGGQRVPGHPRTDTPFIESPIPNTTDQLSLLEQAPGCTGKFVNIWNARWDDSIGSDTYLVQSGGRVSTAECTLRRNAVPSASNEQIRIM